MLFQEFVENQVLSPALIASAYRQYASHLEVRNRQHAGTGEGCVFA